jgi:M6 family metalloprotease-like protein
VLGEKHVLCILANFTNKTMIKTQTEFENLMNQIGYTANGNTGSVKDFYRANSYNKMDITVSVVGPVELTNTAAYYASGIGQRRFAREVATLANSLVDYSLFAVNGRVPSFHIFFAGYGDENINNGQQIWSHKWAFINDAGTNYQFLQFDGVWLGDSYSCSPELSGSSGTAMTYIGVACH